MKVLVCGGRDLDDKDLVYQTLDNLPDVDFVITGGARGADSLAVEWAISRNVHYAVVPALWDAYGRSAGVLRNKAMLRLVPDMVVAFPGGFGTKNMVAQANEKHFNVLEITYSDD